MIELYPLSTVALSLAGVEDYSPASLEHIRTMDVNMRVEHTSGLALNASNSSLLKKLTSVSFSVTCVSEGSRGTGHDTPKPMSTNSLESSSSIQSS